MISPTTPPGTEIICIDASDGRYGPSKLSLNALYTVRAIQPAFDGGHVVTVHEVEPGRSYCPTHGALEIGYELRRFRYLNLPPALTDLLACRHLEDA